MADEALIRVRLAAHDARSESGQVEPTRLMQLFDDVASELCIRQVGDEGILRAYNSIEVLGPLRVGDYIEVRGRIVDAGRNRFSIEFAAHKVIRAARTVAAPLAGEVLDPPRLVARAAGAWLVPERSATTEEAITRSEAVTGEPGAGSEPLSWGGHRPREQPAPKRRPGPTVRMRPGDAERRGGGYQRTERPSGPGRPSSYRGGSSEGGGDFPKRRPTRPPGGPPRPRRGDKE